MDVLDRNALILYLQNVRDLEVAMCAIRNNYKQSKNRYISQLRMFNPTAKVKGHMQKPTRTACENAKDSLKGVFLALFVSFIIIALSKSSFIAVFITFLLFIQAIVCVYNYKTEDEKYAKSIEKWEAYERNLDETNRQEKERSERERQSKQALDTYWNQQSQFYEQQYRIAQSLLDSFYNMNIIPVQYRNLAAICYIYDYISTSRESLTSALLSQQIDSGIKRIEARLVEIVDALEEQIYETRCLRGEAHRSNQRQIEQNTRMLESLRQTEQNTQRAAQYAELGSNYSRANAFFSLATYLKSN